MKGLFKYLIACLYLHSSVNIYAQYEAATWYFGDNSVLKFTTTSAHFFIRNHYLNKGIAMASNCNGEEVITGEDFGGTYLNGGFSQQQILISDPASSNQYYFFYTDNFSDTAYLKYKHVHINSGALTTLGSGNLLFRFAGKLAAVKHQNNNNFPDQVTQKNWVSFHYEKDIVPLNLHPSAPPLYKKRLHPRLTASP
jgi:hypothetical protein